MELSDIELRILGCLVEKEATTPDNYPLSTNSLQSACNQKSNRDPVTSYSAIDVDSVMLELRQKSLARTITGGRANKHKHVLNEAWAVSAAELAVLGVLALRGPQTIGELRTRTERYEGISDPGQVDRVLDQLRARSEPFVRQLPRQPGQKEQRWVHLLGNRSGNPSAAPAVTMPSGPISSASAPPKRTEPATPVSSNEPTEPVSSGVVASAAGQRDEPVAGQRDEPVAGQRDEPVAGQRDEPVAGQRDETEIAALRAEVATLRAQVLRLYELLGEQP